MRRAAHGPPYSFPGYLDLAAFFIAAGFHACTFTARPVWVMATFGFIT